MIVKIQNQWYGIPQQQPTLTVAMISTKQTNKLISHAQNFALTMIKPQHSGNIAAASGFTDQRSSRQQEQIN